MALLIIGMQYCFDTWCPIIFWPDLYFWRKKKILYRQILFSKVEMTPWFFRPLKSDFAPNTRFTFDSPQPTFGHYEKIKKKSGMTLGPVFE